MRRTQPLPIDAAAAAVAFFAGGLGGALFELWRSVAHVREDERRNVAQALDALDATPVRDGAVAKIIGVAVYSTAAAELAADVERIRLRREAVNELAEINAGLDVELDTRRLREQLDGQLGPARDADPVVEALDEHRNGDEGSS